MQDIKLQEIQGNGWRLVVDDIRKATGSSGVIIPWELLEIKDLTPASKLIYALIRSYGLCTENAKTMAVLLGVCEKTVIRGVAELAAGGYIEKSHRIGKCWELSALPMQEWGRSDE